jgi:hypothetical protein
MKDWWRGVERKGRNSDKWSRIIPSYHADMVVSHYPKWRTSL